MIKLDLISYIF